MSKLIQPGSAAPDFSLRGSGNRSFRLSEQRGHPVVLVFYPADWSPVCGDELALFNEILPELERYNATLVGISVDGRWCHKAYAEARNFQFDLLSDFEPKGAVARMYGAWRAEDGTTERALFVIDSEGIIRWSYLSPVDVNPGADGILRALEELQVHEEASHR